MILLLAILSQMISKHFSLMLLNGSIVKPAFGSLKLNLPMMLIF